MTALLEEVIARMQQLPEDVQDHWAVALLGELNGSDGRWQSKFAGSLPALDKLASEALEEEARGETLRVDPESF